jgi:hypothetical protein
MGPTMVEAGLLGLLALTALVITALILHHKADQRRYAQRLLDAPEPEGEDPLIEALSPDLTDTQALALLARHRAGEPDAAGLILARPRGAPGQHVLLLRVWRHGALRDREQAASALYDTRDLDQIADALSCVSCDETSSHAAIERLRTRWEAGDAQASAAIARLVEHMSLRAAHGQRLPRDIERLVFEPAPHTAPLLGLSVAALAQQPGLCAMLIKGAAWQRGALDTAALIEATLTIEDPRHIHMRLVAAQRCELEGTPQHLPALLTLTQGQLRVVAQRAIEAIRERHTEERGQLSLSEDAGAQGGLTQVGAGHGALSATDDRTGSH